MGLSSVSLITKCGKRCVLNSQNQTELLGTYCSLGAVKDVKRGAKEVRTFVLSSAIKLKALLNLRRDS